MATRISDKARRKIEQAVGIVLGASADRVGPSNRRNSVTPAETMWVLLTDFDADTGNYAWQEIRQTEEGYWEHPDGWREGGTDFEDAPAFDARSRFEQAYDFNVPVVVRRVNILQADEGSSEAEPEYFAAWAIVPAPPVGQYIGMTYQVVSQNVMGCDWPRTHSFNDDES